MNCGAPAETAAAQLARAALRHLAQQRLPPTPERYAMAWRAVGGAEAPRSRDGHGAALGPLIAHLLRQLELPHRHWTLARKKEALARLLAAHGTESAPLVERLNRLIDSWQSMPMDDPAEPSALSVAPEPALPGSDTASAAAAADPEPATVSVSPRLQRVLDDMTDLLVAVCDTVPRLVEEEAWVRQQFDAIRAMLRPAAGVPDRRDLAQARTLLARTAEEHQRLLKMRRDSLQMMKTMIAQCIDWLRTLTESSGRFGGRLNTFVEEIERSSDLPALAGTVRQLIEETRAMYAEVDASKSDFAQASERARLLENEVNRLACELTAASTQVMTDHLTSLLNRRGLERSFDELAGRCRTERRPLSLALLDVDDFKRLNDAFGHRAGDDALRHLGRLLHARVRPVDLSARYGGEEFVILMPDLVEEQAADEVRAVQRALTSEVFLHHSQQVFITFSAGVARVRDGEPLQDAVARADDAMYEAKRSGKNRVCVAAQVPA